MLWLVAIGSCRLLRHCRRCEASHVQHNGICVVVTRHIIRAAAGEGVTPAAAAARNKAQRKEQDISKHIIDTSLH